MATDRPYIKLSEVQVTDKTLTTKLDVSKEVEKFLNSDTLTFTYDVPIADVDRSILQVPAVAQMVALGWTLGVDVYVDQLDERFFGGLDVIRATMRRAYPKICFDSQLHVGDIVHNEFHNSAHGLLFTGGVDSTTSYVRNKDKTPNLILVRGLQPELSREGVWGQYQRRMQDFADEQGVQINFIHTNLRDFVDEVALNERYHRYMLHSWWTFRHSIVTLAACAPVTAVKDIKTLIFASTFTEAFPYSWGSHPSIDEHVVWADVGVVHDGFEIGRQDKISKVVAGFVNQYLAEHDRYPYLQICNLVDFDSGYTACGACDMCFQAIAGLLLGGIDPATCGWPMDENVLPRGKQALAGGRDALRSVGAIAVWKDIQSKIPAEVEDDRYGSKPFFDWLRDFDLAPFEKRILERPIHRRVLGPVYRALPKGVRDVLRRSVRA